MTLRDLLKDFEIDLDAEIKVDIHGELQPIERIEKNEDAFVLVIAVSSLERRYAEKEFQNEK